MHSPFITARKRFLYLGILLHCLFVHYVFAAEYLDIERVAPKTALEQGTAIKSEFDQVKETQKSFLKKLMERNATIGSFTRDSSLVFKPRIYNFERKLFDTLKGDYLTAGGSIEYTSGRWKNIASMGLTYSYSTDIKIREDDIPVGLLANNGDSLSVISEAFVRIGTRDSKLSSVLYRQSFNLPYLNRQDSRMIANTFEAYRLDYNTTNLDFVVAYVSKMKRQNSDDFVSMSKRAGSINSNGVIATGFMLDIDRFHIGAINYYNKDTINIFYLETNLEGSYENGIDYQLRTQLSHQRSIGSEDIGNFKTWHWGASIISSWQFIVVNLRYTITGKDSGLKSPWGGRPHYNSLMLLNFDRAGEQSAGLTVSYSLDQWKLPDFSLSMNFARGLFAEDENGVDQEDVHEFDITLDYKPSDKRLNGLWVRIRYGEADRGDKTLRDFRAILNYPVSLF